MNNKWTWLKEYMQKQHLPRRCCRRAEMAKTRVSELLCGKRDFPVNKVFPAAQFLTSIWKNSPNIIPVSPKRFPPPTAKNRFNRQIL